MRLPRYLMPLLRAICCLRFFARSACYRCFLLWLFSVADSDAAMISRLHAAMSCRAARHAVFADAIISACLRLYFRRQCRRFMVRLPLIVILPTLILRATRRYDSR